MNKDLLKIFSDSIAQNENNMSNLFEYYITKVDAYKNIINDLTLAHLEVLADITDQHESAHYIENALDKSREKLKDFE